MEVVVPDEKRLVAYIVAPQGVRAQIEALRSYLGTVLPEYMVPALYVQLNEWPLTTSGKVDRRLLPAPEQESVASRDEGPQGELERALAGIWEQVLRVPQVGRNDNFFKLGGHSLLAMEVVSLVRTRLEIEITIDHLLSHPRIAELAAEVSGAKAVECATI
jgi:acyl carrier protein